MSSLIEQAAERLAQLRAAGIEVPEVETPASTVAGPAVAAPSPWDNPAVQAPPMSPPLAPLMPLPPSYAASEAEGMARSRRIELNLAAIAAAGIVTPQAPRSHMADQYRVIKRPLIANAVGKGAAMLTHGNLIMVTSALPGEGKSFTSINLAMSIAAELDHTVMLVDADVARPSVLKMLGLPPGPGLLELLEGKAEMADVLLRTNVD